MEQYIIDLLRKKAGTDERYSDLLADEEALEYFVEEFSDTVKDFLERNFDLFMSSILIQAEGDEIDEEDLEELGDLDAIEGTEDTREDITLDFDGIN